MKMKPIALNITISLVAFITGVATATGWQKITRKVTACATGDLKVEIPFSILKPFLNSNFRTN